MQSEQLIVDLLEPGNNVQIEFNDETNSKIVFRANVFALEEKQVKLGVSRQDTKLFSLAPNTPLTLIARSKDQSHDYILFTKYLMSDPKLSLLVLERPDQEHFVAGRRAFRCDVKLPFSFFEHLKELKGEVTNLSATGLFAVFDPGVSLKEGMDLTCKITLPTSNKTSFFVGEIVRVQKGPKNQGIGVHFKSPSKEFQDQIAKYLFERQRININLSRRKLRSG